MMPLDEVKQSSQALHFYTIVSKAAPGLKFPRIEKMGGRATDVN